MASLRSPLLQLVNYDLVVRGYREPGAGDQHDAVAVADAPLPAGSVFAGFGELLVFLEVCFTRPYFPIDRVVRP